MIIDMHCHYTLTRLRPVARERFSFEARGDEAGDPPERPELPTDYDSCTSPRALNRPLWRALRWFLDYPPPGPELDQRLAAEYERHLMAGGPVERFVLLAFDAVHDDNGRCVPLPASGDRFGSDIYSSNSFIRGLCQRHPQRFLFGASVHPYRPDAPAYVEEVFRGGACLLKWIPLHQNIDIGDERSIAVLRRCATLGLPVLVHYAEEFTLTTNRPALRAIQPLLETLRGLRRAGEMPAVIVAHAATPATALGATGSHGALLEGLRGEFADAPLYADISAMTTWFKIPYLRRLARHPELHHKLLFGSDFPVPPALLRLRGDLGGHYGRLAAMRAWPQQAALVYRHLGFNEIVFHRAALILPNVSFFGRGSAAVAS